MNICEVDSPINSNNQYCMKFQYNSVVDVHQIINYIRLKYTLNGKSYMFDYDNFEHEINTAINPIQYKLPLNTVNSKLKMLPENTPCHLIICLKEEILSPSLAIKV